MATKDDQATVAEVLAAEEERIRIFAAADYEALSNLMAEELTYTHLTGEVNRKSDYMEHMKESFEEHKGNVITREALEVRPYGDFAILTGRLFNHRNGALSPARVVLQVWIKRAGKWLLAAHQTTALSEKFLNS